MKRNMLMLFLLLVMIFCLAGCFPQRAADLDEAPAGFFTGVWHGWIAPLSLIVSLFDHDVRIYETNNTGWWYDFGYYIAIIAGFGGIAFSRRRKAKETER